MSDDLDVFARPVLRGPRFEDHAIPVEALEELERYRKLVIEVAKALYKRKANAKQIPTAFTSSFQLKLRDVDHNCATPVLTVDASAAPALLADGISYLSYYADSRELIARTVGAASERQPLPPEFPVELLKKLEELGSGLEDTETFELRGPHKGRPGPVYDKPTREYLKKRREAPSVIKLAAFQGAVVSFSDKGTFELRIIGPSVRLECKSNTAIEAKVIAALKGRRYVRAHVRGQTKFNGVGVAEQVQQVLDFKLWTRTDEASVQQLEDRVSELAKLPDGWLEGDGRALSATDLAWLRGHMSRLMADHGVPRPKLYAMADGGVQAVWRALPWRLEAEFNMDKRTVSLLALNIETDADDEKTLELKTPDGWRNLLEYIKTFIPLADERRFNINEEGQS